MPLLRRPVHSANASSRAGSEREPTDPVAADWRRSPQELTGTAGLPDKLETPSLAIDIRPRFQLVLHPEVVHWVVPACMILLFILFLFPWVTSPLSGKYAFEQSGIGAAFAAAEPNPEPKVSFAPWLVLYFIVLLLGVLASVALVVAKFGLSRIGIQLPPLAQMVIGHRTYILGGLALLTFVFLALQLVMGLPAEYKSFAGLAPEHSKDAAQEYDAIMGALLHRTVWLKMATTINLIAVLAALADFWLERRVGRPLPRVVAEW